MEQTERRSSSNSQSAGNASRSTFSGSRPTETRGPEQEETSGKQRPTETRDTNDSTYASPDDYSGQIVSGKYYLLSKISAGGESILYSCSANDGNEYCIKLYFHSGHLQEGVREKLLKIRHKNILPLLDWGKWQGGIYEVFPITPSPTLEDRVKDGSIKKYNEKSLIRQMVEAIHAVHSVGIIHQDIKPANFLVLDTGEVKLIDFGISGIKGDDGRTHITVLGQTTLYASPEVRLGRFCWPESDYYSLGATIYQMFFGKAPYSDYDENLATKLYDDIRQTKIPHIKELPKEKQDLLVGLMQYEKEKRWAYEAVSDWCRGNYSKWTIRRPSSQPNDAQKKFSFAGTSYDIPDQISDLALAMISEKWNTDDFDRRFGTFNTLRDLVADIPELYRICNKSRMAEVDNNVNACYFMMVYDLCPSLTAFGWRGCFFKDLKQFGEAMLTALWKKEASDITGYSSDSSPSGFTWASARAGKAGAPATLTFGYVQELIKNHLISYYLNIHGEVDLSSKVFALESSVNTRTSTLQEGYYQIAYLISHSSKVYIYGQAKPEISGVAEFRSVVNSVIAECAARNSNEPFHSFCSKISENNTLKPGFKAWAENQGFSAAIDTLIRKWGRGT